MSELKTKVGVGIVGMGKMGIMHSAILNSLHKSKVVAICDTSRFFNFVAKKLHFPGKIFKSYIDLISDPEVDLVYITTPVFLHYPIIIECINKEKGFFVEKPLCIGMNEAESIATKLDAANLKTMVGYVYNFKPTYKRLSELLFNKKLGKVISFEAFSYKSSVKKRSKSWRFNRDLSGGGVVTSFGSHILSVIVNIFGQHINLESRTESYFDDDIEDFAEVSLEFKSSIKGKYKMDWTKGSYRKEDNRIKVFCENGEITADNYQIKIKNSQSGTVTKIPVQEIWEGSPLDLGGTHFSIQDSKFVESFGQKEEAYTTSCSHGIQVQKLIQDIYEA